LNSDGTTVRQEPEEDQQYRKGGGAGGRLVVGCWLLVVGCWTGMDCLRELVVEVE